MANQFTGKSAPDAADKVVRALRSQNWVTLRQLLDSSPEAAGSLADWQKLPGPPVIGQLAEVQRIPELMSRYPGKLLVRYDVPDDQPISKVKVVVDDSGDDFRVIDFWGLGW